MPAGQRMGVGDLAEENARGRHELLKRQGTPDQKAGEPELTQHDPIEQAGKDHRQAAQTALEQAQAQQAGERKEAQLRVFS